MVSQVSLSLLLLVTAGLFLRNLRELSGDRPGLRRRAAAVRAAARQPAALHAGPGPRLLPRRRRARFVSARRRVRERRAGRPARGGGRVEQHPRGGTAGPSRPVPERGCCARARARRGQLQRDRPGLLRDPRRAARRGPRLRRARRAARPRSWQSSTRRSAACTSPTGSAATCSASASASTGPRVPGARSMGVVGDSKYGSLTEEPVPVAYLPLSQQHETGVVLYVRTSVAPASLVAAVRREVQRARAQPAAARAAHRRRDRLELALRRADGSAPARRLRRARAAAGGDRRLQRDQLRGRPAHPRDRRPHGARRRLVGRAAPGAAARAAARRDRRRGGARARRRRRPLPRELPLRRARPRPAHVRRPSRSSSPPWPSRLPRARAPGDEARPAGARFASRSRRAPGVRPGSASPRGRGRPSDGTDGRGAGT